MEVAHLLHGTVRFFWRFWAGLAYIILLVFLHGAVRFVYDTVRFSNGTVRFLHEAVRFVLEV